MFFSCKFFSIPTRVRGPYADFVCGNLYADPRARKIIVLHADLVCGKFTVFRLCFACVCVCMQSSSVFILCAYKREEKGRESAGPIFPGKVLV